MKKVICLLFVLLLLLPMSRDSYIQYPRCIPLSREAGEIYDPYGLDISALEVDTGLASPVEAVLSICDYRETFYAGGDVTAELYESSKLQNYLYDYADHLEIGMIGSNLYITYRAKNGAELTLQYNSDGLIRKTVYFCETDHLIDINSQSVYGVYGLKQ